MHRTEQDHATGCPSLIVVHVLGKAAVIVGVVDVPVVLDVVLPEVVVVATGTGAVPCVVVEVVFEASSRVVRIAVVDDLKLRRERDLRSKLVGSTLELLLACLLRREAIRLLAQIEATQGHVHLVVELNA